MCACVRLSHIHQSKYTQSLNNLHDSLKSNSVLEAAAQNIRVTKWHNKCRAPLLKHKTGEHHGAGLTVTFVNKQYEFSNNHYQRCLIYKAPQDMTCCLLSSGSTCCTNTHIHQRAIWSLSLQDRVILHPDFNRIGWATRPSHTYWMCVWETQIYGNDLAIVTTVRFRNNKSESSG